MRLFRPRERLHLVAPLFDWILEFLKLVLLPIAILSVGYRFIFQIAAVSREAKETAAYSAAVVAACVLYILLIQTKPARDALSTIATGFRRAIVISCVGASAAMDQAWSICRLASGEFRRPRVTYPDQQIVVEKLVESLGASRASKTNFSVVLGESGYGKTRIAFLLADALIRDRKLSTLTDRVLYYDLSEGVRVQEAFLRHLGGVWHWDAVVIVDNFHQAPPRVLRMATRHVLDGPAAAERFMLFLAQPPRFWKSALGGEARILTEAKTRGHLFKLRGVSKDAVAREGEGRALRSRIERISRMNAGRVASIAELHVLQMSKLDHQEGLLADEVVQLLGAGSQGGPDGSKRVIRVLGVATALSIERGSFTFDAFLRATWRVCATERAGFVEVVRTVWTLRRLARLGVVPRTSLPGRLFVFHEALATAFMTALAEDAAFRCAFEAAMRWRLAEGSDREDPAIQWIGACELRSTERMAVWFERALLGGGLHVMAAHLEPNWKNMRDSPTATFQLGLLLDRCGRFTDARRYFGTLRQNVDIDPDLSDRLSLAEVEASHADDAVAQLEAIVGRGSPENRLAARYWRTHLDGHRGVFHPQALLRLADDLIEQFGPNAIGRSYSLTYLAARIVFDGCRQGLLATAEPTIQLSQLAESALMSVLVRSYPQHQAMCILYLRAHVLGHLLLPTCAIQGRVDTTAAKFLNLDPTKLNREVITDLARAAYSEAKDEFSVSGDREHLYIDADLINLDICDPRSKLDEVQIRLHEYERFIRDSGFADIASYAQFYWYRWHVAKRFWLLDQEHCGIEDVDWHDAEAMRRLKLADTLDQACGNAYGQWRCGMHRTLFESLSKARGEPLKPKLQALETEARSLGYARDAALLEGAARAERPSLLEIRQILLFHPFVHQ